jgi:hypothetical protein
MTTAAAEFLKSFESLTPEVQREVLGELLRMVPAEYGPLPDDALTEIADELFRAYDEEEARAAGN